MEEIENTSVTTRIGIEERLKPVCSESSPVGSTPTSSTKKKTGPKPREWECKYCKQIFISRRVYYEHKRTSEEQVREWAEDSINRTQLGPNWLIPWDCSRENFNKKVRPIIDEVLQERKKKQKRDYRQKKIDEAIEMLKEANSTCDEDGDSYDYQGYSIMHDIVFINAVATLLEKIEDLEGKASLRDIWNDRFTI